ncbi:MAG: TIGR02679 family protein [Pseudonocardiaceae bacterium]
MTGTEPPDDLRGASWARLLAAARRQLERTGGRLDSRIGLTAATDDERRVVIGLTGRHRAPGTTRLSVSLSELDAGLRRVRGEGLLELLTRLGGPVRDRPAEAATEAATRDTALNTMASTHHKSETWYERWRAELAADGTATRLVRRGESHLLTQATAVLEALPATGIPLPMLAEQVTGDPKALSGGALAHLVLRALALRENCAAPETAEQRRALWDSAGVVVDDLASQVLVLNLRADGAGLGEWLTQAARLGVPLRVTLHQLTALPVVPQVPEVFVCENPAVLRQATAQLGSRSAALVCTEGVPSLPCWRLLEAAAVAGARIRWRNDFDWSGLRITASAIDRLSATPWRMTTKDFLAALALGDTEPLRGTPSTSPWDPTLATALSSAGRSIMEERLVPLLLADLAGIVPRPPVNR